MDWKDVLFNSFKDKFYNFEHLKPRKVYVRQSLIDANTNEIESLLKRIRELELQLDLEKEEKRRIGTELEILINEQNQLR